MEFRDNKAIYLQIADYVYGIFCLKNGTSTKVPSVREMAVELEVNPNTVMRTYELLQSKNIINNKKNIVVFVADDALSNVKAYQCNLWKMNCPDF